ncbi:acetolactate synthase [Microbacterium lushaniae]|nr:acetolactate synthase [Microbacterium lushaniae]KAA9149401.1 acetolactate synthase [Microbacterium lushaniae]
MTRDALGAGGGAAIVAALRANGVRTAFGIPGTHNLEIYRYLARSGITHVLCRHEQGAAYAADGYARSGGGIAAVIVTSGPGLLNASAGIANAHADRVPMIVIAPVIDRGRERRDVGWMHEVKDQRAALDAVAGWSETAADAQDAAALVDRAFMEWRAGETRPVVINVPHDVLVNAAIVTPSDPLPAPLPATPADEVLLAAHGILTSARTPVVVVGGGCVRGHREVRGFLELLGAPVIATGRGKGVLPDGHPLSLGAVIGTSRARAVIEIADAVLLIGTELSEAELLDEPLRPIGSIIRVDRELNQLHKGARATLPILADAARFATAMTELDGWDPSGESRVQAIRDAVAEEISGIAAPYATLHEALSDALPEDAIIVGDSSQVSYMGTTLLWRSPQPDRVLGPLGFATLGYGLPAAIGAALANPGTAVACVLGDGALMFSVQELSTAVDLGLSLPVVVFDNRGFGEIRDQMNGRDIDPLGVDIDQPDFTELGKAFGCATAVAADKNELVDAMRQSLNAGRPTVIHVRAHEFN